MSKFLFLVASSREPGQLGNTEWLARQAAGKLPTSVEQRWIYLAQLQLPPFTDLRHTTACYPLPEGDLRLLLDATLECSDLVLVQPLYWFSIPATTKLYLDHWTAWLRIPAVPFKEQMRGKRLHLVSTGGERAKAQPMIDSVRLCADFMAMNFVGVLWGKGGVPGAVEQDAEACQAAQRFFLA